MPKRIFALIFSLGLLFFAFPAPASAGKITVLYTGETHADLYPCHCPVEPFGGVARRAAKVKELRQANPDLLLIDAGNYFAGGKLDEYSTGEALDQGRTRINLLALKKMGYDGVGIGDAELGFGGKFLQQQIKESGLKFISCNARIKGAQKYLVKKISGIKIGIVAVTPDHGSLVQEGISEPMAGLKSTVDILEKKEKVNLIILLSSLGEEKDTGILQEITGIDFIISARPVFGREKDAKTGNGVILRPAWQGRKLGRLEIEMESGKIKDYSVELIGLGADVPDDAEIKKLLPACFSQNDCVRTNLKGECQNPGSKEAACVYREYAAVPLLAIEPRDCRTCNSGPFLAFLKNQFPGAQVKSLSPEDGLAARLIKEFSIKMLPAYLIGRQAENEGKSAALLEKFSELKSDYYYFSPSFAGMSYFLNRPPIGGKLDLFISLSDRFASKVIATVRRFLAKYGQGINFTLHFVAWEDTAKGELVSPGGQADIQESKRALCVNKYSPAQSWDYFACRADNLKSGDWEKCLKDKKSSDRIKECAEGQEADGLLKDNIALGEEIRLNYSPVFLLDNHEVFGVTDRTSEEELKKFIINGNKR